MGSETLRRAKWDYAEAVYTYRQTLKRVAQSFDSGFCDIYQLDALINAEQEMVSARKEYIIARNTEESE